MSKSKQQICFKIERPYSLHTFRDLYKWFRNHLEISDKYLQICDSTNRVSRIHGYLSALWIFPHPNYSVFFSVWPWLHFNLVSECVNFFSLCLFGLHHAHPRDTGHNKGSQPTTNNGSHLGCFSWLTTFYYSFQFACVSGEKVPQWYG